MWVYPVISHKLTHKYREDQVQFSSIIRCVSLRGGRGEYLDLVEPLEHPETPPNHPRQGNGASARILPASHGSCGPTESMLEEYSPPCEALRLFQAWRTLTNMSVSSHNRLKGAHPNMPENKPCSLLSALMMFRKSQCCVEDIGGTDVVMNDISVSSKFQRTINQLLSEPQFYRAEHFQYMTSHSRSIKAKQTWNNPTTMLPKLSIKTKTDDTVDSELRLRSCKKLDTLDEGVGLRKAGF